MANDVRLTAQAAVSLAGILTSIRGDQKSTPDDERQSRIAATFSSSNPKDVRRANFLFLYQVVITRKRPNFVKASAVALAGAAPTFLDACIGRR
ncbi:MAG: hypothetical protein ACK41X_17515 [Pseudorhodoplanes sp.]